MADKKVPLRPDEIASQAIPEIGGSATYIDTKKEWETYSPLPPEDSLFRIPEKGDEPLSVEEQKKEDAELEKHFLRGVLPPKKEPAKRKKHAEAVTKALHLALQAPPEEEEAVLIKAIASFTGETPKDTLISTALRKHTGQDKDIPELHLRNPVHAALVADILGDTNNPLADLPEEPEELPEEKEGEEEEVFGAIPRGDADVAAGEIERTTGPEEWEVTEEEEHRALMEKSAREEGAKFQAQRERALFLKSGIKPEDIPAGIQQAVEDVYGETEQLTNEDLKAFAQLPQEHQEKLLLPTPEQFATLEEFEGAGYKFNDAEGNAITDREELKSIFDLWQNPPELPEGQDVSPSDPKGINIVGLGGSLVAELGTGIYLSHVFKSHAKWLALLKVLKAGRAASKAGIVAPEGGSTVAGLLGYGVSEGAIWGFSNILGQGVRNAVGVSDKFYASELIGASLAGIAFQPIDEAVRVGGRFMLPNLKLNKGLADMEVWGKGSRLWVSGSQKFVSGAALGLLESTVRQEVAVRMNEQETRHLYDYLLSSLIGGSMNSVFGIFARTGSWGRAQEDLIFRRSATKLAKQLSAKEGVFAGKKEFYEFNYRKEVGDGVFMSKADYAKKYPKELPERYRPRRLEPFEAMPDGAKLAKEIADITQSQELMADFLVKNTKRRFVEDGIAEAKRLGKRAKRDPAALNPEPAHYPKPGEAPAPKTAPEAEAPVVKGEEPEAPPIKAEEPEVLPPKAPKLEPADTTAYPAHREVPENLEDLEKKLIEMRERSVKGMENKEEGVVVPEVTGQAKRMVEEIDFEITKLIQSMASGGSTPNRLIALRRELQAAEMIYRELLGTFSAMEGRGLLMFKSAFLQNPGKRFTGPVSAETLRLRESMRRLIDDIDERLRTGLDDLDDEVADDLARLIKGEEPEVLPAGEIIKTPAKDKTLGDTLSLVNKVLAGEGKLDDIPYRDLQKLAKELGVPAKGPKETLINNIRKREATATKQATAKTAKPAAKSPAVSLAEKVDRRVAALQKKLQKKLESYYPKITGKDPAKGKPPATGDAAAAKAAADADPEIVALRKSIKNAQSYKREAEATVKAEKEAARLAGIAARGDPEEMAKAVGRHGATRKEVNQQLKDARKGVKAAKALMSARLKQAQGEKDAILWERIYLYAFDEHAARAVGKWSTVLRGGRVARKLAMIDSLTSVQAAGPTGFAAVGRLFYKPLAFRLGGHSAVREAGLNGKMAQISMAESVRALKGLFTSQTWKHFLQTYKQGADPQFGGRAISRFDDYTQATRSLNPRGLDQAITQAKRNAALEAKANGSIMKFIDDNAKTGAFFRLLSMGARGIQAVDAAIRRNVSIAERNTKLGMLAHLEHPKDVVAAARKADELIAAHTKEVEGITIIKESEMIAGEMADVERAFLLTSRRDNIEDVTEAMTEKFIIRPWTEMTQNDTEFAKQMAGSFGEFLMPFFTVAVRSVVRGTHLGASGGKLVTGKVSNPHVKVIRDLKADKKARARAIMESEKSPGSRTNPEQVAADKSANERLIADYNRRIKAAEFRKARWNHEVLTDTLFAGTVASMGLGLGYAGLATGSNAWMTPDQKKKSQARAYKIKTPFGELDYRTWVPVNIILTVMADLGAFRRAKEEGRVSKDVTTPQAIAQSIANLSRDLPTSGLGYMADIERGGESFQNSWSQLVATIVPVPSQAKKIVKQLTQGGTIADFRGKSFYERIVYQAVGHGPESKKVNLLGEDIDTGRTWVNTVFRFGGYRDKETSAFITALSTDHDAVVQQEFPDTIQYNLKMRDFVDGNGVTLRYRFAQRLKKRGIKKEVERFMKSDDYTSNVKRYNRADGKNVALINLNEFLSEQYTEARNEMLEDSSFLRGFISAESDAEGRNLLDVIRNYEDLDDETFVGPAPLPTR